MIHINDYPRLPAFRRPALRAFLAAHDLAFDNDIDGIVLAETDTGEIKGCIAHHAAVLQYFCVDSTVREEGLGTRLISTLINRLLTRYATLQAFTAPERIATFQALGFRLLAQAPPLYALLEFGPQGIEDYLHQVHQLLPSPHGPYGAIVMNANPFTRGHRHLIEYAAQHCPHLIVFVVRHEQPRFSFIDRFTMVSNGCADLSNVSVCSGGEYMVSSATFPHYFIKQPPKAQITAHQSRLDATLFATRIAPMLQITQRFVGEEPFSPVTACYNDTLHDILPAHGIEVCEIPRLAHAGEAISASRVRALLTAHDGDWQALVPETTRQYLIEHDLT